MKQNFLRMTMVAALACAPLIAASTTTPRQELSPLENKIRRELVTLPFYGVFDNLQFSVNGDTVVLSGQVYRPTMKKSAQRVVERLEGVETVVNNIEVLPVSFHDDRVRMAVLRSVYSQPALQRYGLGANPSIHIIVKNGDVTLEGMVANEMDRNIAGIRANGVFGAFSVTNNLRVEQSDRKRS